jgi:HlyD family secretion protein
MKQYLVVKQRKNKVLLFTISGGIFIALLLWWLQQPGSIPSGHRNAYFVTEITASSQISGMGVIYPKHKTIISAPVSGYVTQLNVRQGQQVKQGDLLLVLENDELQQDYANSQFDYQNVQASIAIKTAELQERSFQLQNQLTRAKTEYEKQKLELDARRTLVASGVVSSIQFRQAELSASQAETEVALLTKQLDSFNHNIEQQQQALQSQLNAAKQRTAYLQQRIDQLSFYAERDAIISKLPLDRGQSVQQGQQLLEWLEQNQLLARVQLPQHTAGQIRLGLAAKVNTPFGPVAASVSYINPVVKAGAYQAELSLQPHQLPLAIDQDIEAVIDTGDIKTRLIVNKPYGFSSEGWKVYLKKQNRAELINLSVRQQTEDTLFLDNSLAAGNTLWFIPAQLVNSKVLRLPDAS